MIKSEVTRRYSAVVTKEYHGVNAPHPRRTWPAIGSKVIGNKKVPMKEKEKLTLAGPGLTKRESRLKGTRC